MAATSGGQAYSARRVSHFRMTPQEVDDLIYIAGIDGPEDGSDVLWDPSIEFSFDDDMLNSIDEYGVLEPPLVTPRVINGEKRAVVVDGRDRVRHLRQVNESRLARGEQPHELDVINHSGSEDELLELRIAANTRRERSIMYFVYEAARLHKEMGKSRDELAKMYGKSESTIDNWVALAGAKKKVRDAVDKGVIPPTAGYRLGKLPADEQEDALQELMDQTGGARGTARAAKGVSQARKGGANGSAAATPANKRPGAKELGKLRAAADADDAVMATLQGCDGYDLMRWLLGEVTERVLPKPLRDALK
jgi:ParB-like chromosome segregation protein Spo0J